MSYLPTFPATFPSLFLEHAMSAIGLRVGPFEIRDDVTVPGTGTWYLAERTGLTRRQPSTVLVRLLGPTPSSRELAGLQREFDVLKSLDDKRFPRPVALYEGTGALAVEAPLCVPLSRVVQARLLGDVVMTPATLLDVGLDLAEALAYAHQKGRVHGHLSADNVALTGDGSLQVWGMGDPEARSSFSWLAPERARGESPTQATDQWSLGAVMVALVTGRLPWSAASAGSDPRTGDIEEFVQAVASQWPALGRLVRRMLDPNPSARFPSLHAVRLELLSLSRKAGGTSDRRRLGSWLQRQITGTPMSELSGPEAVAAVPVEVEIEIDEAEDIAVIRADTAPEPASPQIHVAAASRANAAGVPGYGGGLHAEAMAVVVPDALEEVPVARVSSTPPPVRARVMTPVSEVTDPDLLATEMVQNQEDRLATDVLATETVPPASIRLSGPSPAANAKLDAERVAGLADGASTPASIEVRMPATPVTVELEAFDMHEFDFEDDVEPLAVVSIPDTYRVEPSPTLPGMDLPEPHVLEESTPSPVVRVASTPVLNVAPTIAVRPSAAPVMATIELDPDWEMPEDRGGAQTVVPFTDPVFAGPSLGLQPIEVDALPEPAASDDTAGPGWFIDPVTDEAKPAGFPWEGEPAEPRGVPRDFRIVRVAPWLATVATVALLMLTVWNVAT